MKVEPFIPYGRQSIDESDIAEVCSVLRSDYLTQGPMVSRFEKAVLEYTGANYAIAVNSATSALHLSCLALGLGSGDILWTSPITFVASANCALYCNARVDFVDIDPLTLNMSSIKLAEKLKVAKREKKLPKIVVVVHFAGLPCDMLAIGALSKEYGFSIIEDASHAIGGQYAGEPIGSSQYSDITVFSFHPVKIITSGEGGMAVTNEQSVAEIIKLLSSHGITRESQKMEEETHGPWFYQQIDLGFNYRLTDIHAALGYSQMKKLDTFVRRRYDVAVSYDELLYGLPLRLPHYKDSVCSSGLHLYVIRLQLDEISKTHRQVFEEMRSNGIGVNLHYIPVHMQPQYKRMGFKTGDFPQAEKYYSEAISLPMFPDLKDSQIEKVVSTLKNCLK